MRSTCRGSFGGVQHSARPALQNTIIDSYLIHSCWETNIIGDYLWGYTLADHMTAVTSVLSQQGKSSKGHFKISSENLAEQEKCVHFISIIWPTSFCQGRHFCLGLWEVPINRLENWENSKKQVGIPNSSYTYFLEFSLLIPIPLPYFPIYTYTNFQFRNNIYKLKIWSHPIGTIII